MSQNSSVPPTRVPAEKLVRDVHRAARRLHSAEENPHLSGSAPRCRKYI